MKKFIYPQTIISFQNASGIENLKMRKNMQVGFYENIFTQIGPGGYVLLDFGKEICGSLRLVTYFNSGDRKVHITYGESVSEALSHLGTDPSGAGNTERDFSYVLPNLTDLTFTNSGFRFALIESIGNSTILIKNAVVVPAVYSRPFTGSFQCDDELINRIYDTSAYTLRLCLQNNVIWDGIKRGRLVWSGDLSPDILGINCLFGKIPHVENTLSFLKNETPLPLWMNNLPSYSLWWIIVLRDYYLHNKNHKYLSDNGAYLKALTEQIAEHVADDGETTYPVNFMDNYTQCKKDDPDTEKRNDETAGIHALTVYAMKCAKELLGYLNMDDGTCDAVLERLAQKKHSVCRFSQMAALRSAAGIADEHDSDLIAANGADGLTAFLSYYILKGMCSCGGTSLAAEAMKEYYGGMLSLGATSFWEHFDMEKMENAGRIDVLPEEGRKDVHAALRMSTSFCHGWACGPVPFLTYVVGGIEILKPGCEEIRITPSLGKLNHVKIAYPTPYGILHVEHTKSSDGRILTKTIVPDGVKITK